MTDKQKKAIKVGAAVVATALVTYGAYRLGKSGKLDEYVSVGRRKVDALLNNKKAGSSDETIERGKQKVESILGKTQKAAQSAGGIKRLSKPESLTDTLNKVNPLRGSLEGRNNCSACGIASFLRRNGYDVVAKGTGGKQQILGGVVEECFKGAKVIDGSAVKFGRSRKDADEMLLKRFGENASGVVSIQWKDKRRGGHIFNWQINNGIVSFFDGQSGGDNSIVSNYWDLVDPKDALTIARLDNAEINFDAITKYIKNR